MRRKVQDYIHQTKNFLSDETLNNTISVWSLGLLVCLINWWQIAETFPNQIALTGFSPIGWIYKLYDPENFLNDYPSGTENYNASLFLWIYRLFFRLGVLPEHVLPYILLLEIIVFFAAAVYLSKTFIKSRENWVHFLVATILSFSVGILNIANARSPFPIGQYYNLAEAMRMFGIALIWRARYREGLFLLLFNMMIHPTMGLFGLLFVVPKCIMEIKNILKLKVLLPNLLIGIISASWLLYWSRNLTAANIFPLQEYINLSKLMNYHLFPVTLGFLSTQAHLILLPTLSVGTLAFFCWSTYRESLLRDRSLLLSLGLTFLITVVSLIILEYNPTISLIKLYPFRISSLLFIFMFLATLELLSLEISNEQRFSAILIILFLISSFQLNAFYSHYFIFGLALTWIFQKRLNTVALLVLLCFLGITLFLGSRFGLSSLGSFPTNFELPNASNMLLGKPTFSFATYLVVVIIMALSFNCKRVWLTSFLIVLFACGSIAFTFRNQPTLSSRTRALHYKDIQLWAKNSTPRGTHFAPDPSIAYGWRDYSQRPSFGNYREWLMTGWLYNSNLKIYKDGMERASHFVSVSNFINKYPVAIERNKLQRAIRSKFYRTDGNLHKTLASQYGIDFFIFEKALLRPGSCLKPSYSNESFIVVESSFFEQPPSTPCSTP